MSNKQHSNSGGCTPHFISLDNFGEQINFRIEGKSSFKSVCGSVTTILMFIILLFYSQQKYIVMSVLSENEAID